MHRSISLLDCTNTLEGAGDRTPGNHCELYIFHARMLTPNASLRLNLCLIFDDIKIYLGLSFRKVYLYELGLTSS
jgi:hypothetical protein